MTYREKIMKERPELVDDYYVGGVKGCPGRYFEGAPTNKPLNRCPWQKHGDCTRCWNMEMEEKSMTAKEIYEKEFAYYVECLEDRDIYEWAADHIFGLTTYDGYLDKLFVQTILGVCKVILNKQAYELIRDESMYFVYIVVCQLLNKKGWINWGTSIRGAWLEDGKDAEPIYESYDEPVSVPFTIANLIALIEFIEEHEPKEEEAEV